MQPSPPPPPLPPSSRWPLVSAATILATGFVGRAFLYGTQRVVVEGRESFLQLLDDRRHHHDRGLLTVSNHKSVVDDPLLWAPLPLRYLLPPAEMRHALGSADICFTTRARAAYFGLGQVHATFRSHKALPGQGGLFQPVIGRLATLLDAPTAAWVHVFPEARVHQHPAGQMRYFKWGVARLLLEPAVQPVLVPIFIDGLDRVLPEDRGFPRFLPRVANTVTVVYGDPVDDSVFADLRKEWRRLREFYGCATADQQCEPLRTGREAVELRIETARRVRAEVEKLRRAKGFPPEDENAHKAETYQVGDMVKHEGRLPDGSKVEDM